MRVWTGSIESEFDVVVVGSGAIALTAALYARVSGASVLVLEKSSYFGGTSAMSGGMLWIPLNHHGAEQGVEDNRAAALTYLRRISNGRTSDATLDALVDRGNEMLLFIESNAPLKFASIPNFPDYRAEWAGGREGGRSIEPELLDASILGDLRESVRPLVTPALNLRRAEAWRKERVPFEDFLEQLEEQNLLSRGNALVGALLRGCADAGVVLATDEGVEQLLSDGERISGARSFGGRSYEATTAVILACGGFEWSPEMTKAFVPAPIESSCSSPHNTGDGIRMAAKVGAQLASMFEAWWQPQMLIPGHEADGVALGTGISFERTAPGSIIVNRSGKRFVNEACNYNDMTKAFHDFDPKAAAIANLPAHLIFDHGHLERYGFQGIAVGGPLPGWLATGDTLRELAESIGVDGEGLEATVRNFNNDAVAGVDRQFHRGETPYERYQGDGLAAHPNLGPVNTPPFYAVRVRSGVIGTKGGIVTNADGQAIDVFGDEIPELYAAGNTTAHPAGPGYPGAGGTLGPGMTMAYLAARHAVSASDREPSVAR